LTRRDHRHNFSPYFYDIYLGYNRFAHGSFAQLIPARIASLLPFALQFAVVWTIGCTFWRDPPFACFAQTLAFVTFNKVCTSQYFMWYLCFLPLVLPSSRLPLSKGAFMLTLWTLGQALWLVNAFFLEHKGWNTFLQTWVASLVFFFINCWVLVQFITHQTISKWFNRGMAVPGFLPVKLEKNQ